MRTFHRSTLLAAVCLIGAAACAPFATDAGNATQADIDAAFASSVPGLGSTLNTFADSGDTTYRPHRGPGKGGFGKGGRGLLAAFPGNGLMGGGLRLEFIGGIGSHEKHGRGRGPFGGFTLSGANCSTTGGRVTCTDTTRGLVVVSSAAYTTAAGAVQAAYDSATTNTINWRTSVNGTHVGRDSAVTSTVSHSSDRTVSGLAPGSTQRTVNGTSAGTENARGTNREGVAFTATRTVGDTVTGIVVPVSTSGKSYPTAGTVIRSMRATVTLQGAEPVTSTRREVITYDGSATAKLVITRNGVTTNCTLALPQGRPNCG